MKKALLDTATLIAVLGVGTSVLQAAQPFPTLSLTHSFGWVLDHSWMDTSTTTYSWVQHDAGRDDLGSIHNWSFDHTDTEICIGDSPDPNAPWSQFYNPLRFIETPNTFRYRTWVQGAWIVKRRLSDTSLFGSEGWGFQGGDVGGIGLGGGTGGQLGALSSRSAVSTIGTMEWKWEQFILPGGGSNP